MKACDAVHTHELTVHCLCFKYSVDAEQLWYSTNRSVSLLNWPRPTSLTAHRRNWYERAGMRSPTVTPVDSGSILANSTVQGASETGQTSMKSEVWATESEWRMTLLSAFTFLRKISPALANSNLNPKFLPDFNRTPVFHILS